MSRLFEDNDDILDDLISDALTPGHDLTVEGEKLLSIFTSRVKPAFHAYVERRAAEIACQCIEKVLTEIGVAVADGPGTSVLHISHDNRLQRAIKGILQKEEGQ